jgi:hypothetical protein
LRIDEANELGNGGANPLPSFLPGLLMTLGTSPKRQDVSGAAVFSLYRSMWNLYACLLTGVESMVRPCCAHIFSRTARIFGLTAV